MNKTPDLDAVLVARLIDIYGHVPQVLGEGLARLVAEARPVVGSAARKGPLWDERDCVLITYADQVRHSGQTPLQAVRKFLSDYRIAELVNCVHLLPFFPSTSDDGFSVADYLAVDPHCGRWDDIAGLGEDVDLMFDLVLNHASKSHEWFKRYRRGEAPYDDFFISVDPSADLSQVVRPRSLPLLTPFETASGTRHVWTTFSEDQVDLNYAQPLLLLEMSRILVEYARRGARIIRLDAIAFLWKRIGTPCIHLPETHAVVRLMRRLLELTAPGTLVLTETNVPHRENLSYFGQGDEAHLVYQFSLPPLLLDAIHSGDTSLLAGWLADLAPPFPDTTFFNFTASHDGVGVRPLEGLVSDERLESLVAAVRKNGGRVSTRRRPDGSDSPYELNITYMDAVADAASVSASEHARRFLVTQAIMLALRGIPAVYFHSLVGSANDQAAVAVTGHNRSINRHKYDRVEIDAWLAGDESRGRLVLDGYTRLLKLRRSQRAFHPDASQRVLDLPGDGLLGFVRGEAGPIQGPAGEGEPITVVANLSLRQREVAAKKVNAGPSGCVDLLSGDAFAAGQPVPLPPLSIRWLR